MKRFILHLLAFALALGFFIGTAKLAQATDQCRAYEPSALTLFERFQEVPVARGISTNDTIIVIFLNPAKGTWTVLAVGDDSEKMSCIVASGTAWENLPYEEPALKPQLQSL